MAPVPASQNGNRIVLFCLRLSVFISGFRSNPHSSFAIVIAAVRLYQYTLGTILPNSCRFHPTCSKYAIQAVEEHGAGRGLWLAARRILRCHPWGGHGYDPVPEKEMTKSQ